MGLYHKDEHMRGRHLLDTNTGQVWPWTETLSKKEGFKLVDIEPPAVEEPPKERTGPVFKFNRAEPKPVEPVLLEDITVAESIAIHSEHGKPKKGK